MELHIETYPICSLLTDVIRCDFSLLAWLALWETKQPWLVGWLNGWLATSEVKNKVWFKCLDAFEHLCDNWTYRIIIWLASPACLSFLVSTKYPKGPDPRPSFRRLSYLETSEQNSEAAPVQF